MDQEDQSGWYRRQLSLRPLAAMRKTGGMRRRWTEDSAGLSHAHRPNAFATRIN
jgi:hypothetical protein